MKKISVGNTIKNASQIVYGCMRISGMQDTEIQKLLGTALESGINMFDHADIYGGGKSEEVFAKAVSTMDIKREDMIIQSKCGIRRGFFDSSAEHIISSAEGSLRRLGTDYLDILLIHRPDALANPAEISEAFYKLKKAGKVKHFGVSNHNPIQIELLQNHMDESIVANQLQLSITNSGMFDVGIYANIQNEELSVDRDGHILNYCELNDITIQAWSPFNYGFFSGIFIDSPEFPELNAKLSELAEKYDADKSAIAAAWIMKHHSGIQPIIGTTKPERVKNICKAGDFEITRKEWYKLYLSTGKKLP